MTHAPRLRALPLVLLLVLLFQAIPAPARAGESLAERLHFDLHMFGIPVGRATLSTGPLGHGAARHELLVRSNAMVDLLFPVRDRVTSLARTDATGSIRYSKDINEGNWTLAYDLLFGGQRVQRFGPAGRTVILAPPECQDPLSLFFALRVVGPRAGPAARRPVSDGNVVGHSRVRVLGFEDVEVPAGRFRALHVSLETPGVDGIFRLASDEAVHIWVHADESLAPLRLAARVLVGPFAGNLRVDLRQRDTGPEALADADLTAAP